MQCYIAGNFQVVTSYITRLVVSRREKNSSVYLKNFTDFFNTDVFFHFLWQMSVFLVGDAKPVLYAEHVGLETPKHNAFDYIGKTF